MDRRVERRGWRGCERRVEEGVKEGWRGGWRGDGEQTSRLTQIKESFQHFVLCCTMASSN